MHEGEHGFPHRLVGTGGVLLTSHAPARPRSGANRGAINAGKWAARRGSAALARGQRPNVADNYCWLGGKVTEQETTGLPITGLWPTHVRVSGATTLPQSKDRQMSIVGLASGTGVKIDATAAQ